MIYLFSNFWYIVSMEISITLKTHFTKPQSFSKSWCNSHIDKIKESLVKCQLKMQGMVQKKKPIAETTFKCHQRLVTD